MDYAYIKLWKKKSNQPWRGEAFEAAFEKADEELPEDAERSTLFEHMGWKEVKELT